MHRRSVHVQKAASANLKATVWRPQRRRSLAHRDRGRRGELSALRLYERADQRVNGGRQLAACAARNERA